MIEIVDTLQYDFKSWHNDEGQKIIPNKFQRWVWDVVQHPDVWEVNVTGGFGSAKTTTAANCLAKMQAANRERRPGRYGIAGGTHSQLRQSTLAAYWGAVNGATGWTGPIWRNPCVESFSMKENRMRYVWGDEVLWATGHDGLEAWEGGKFTGILTDEGPLFLPVAQRRVRERLRQVGLEIRCLINVFTPQPGRSLTYYHDRCGDLTDGVPRDGVVRIAIPTMANKANLPSGYIDQIRSQYSHEMAEAMIYGKFVLLSGRVYSAYNPDPGGSVIPYTFDEDKAVHLVWDGGYRRPYFGAAQELTDGQRIAFDELALADKSIDEQFLALIEMPWIANVTHIIHDPANLQMQSGMGTSDVRALEEMLRSKGLSPRFVCSTKREDRIITVRVERLRTSLYSASGERALMVAQSLTQRQYPNGRDNMPTVGIHRSMMEQTFRDGSDEPDRRPRVDHLSHPADAWGYGAVYWRPVANSNNAPWERVVMGGAKGGVNWDQAM